MLIVKTKAVDVNTDPHWKVTTLSTLAGMAPHFNAEDSMAHNLFKPLF